MRLRTLDIFVGTARVGVLFQYGEGPTAITRLMPEDAFWRGAGKPLLSWATVTTSAADREAFWGEPATVPFFNGQGQRLPGFFQNMLPEGALRRHIAQVRGCPVDDHFELLAACGTDLPGAVYAYPTRVTPDLVAGLVTQHHETVEMSVVAEPMREATSLSGLQPKLSLVREPGGRYVARTRDARGVHIIAKLPTAEFPRMPEVEALSLALARQAGVDTCDARLARLEEIDAQVPFALDASRNFLAVERFDRADGTRHIHCEDFAQILGIAPEEKYTHPLATYAVIAAVLAQMGLGEPAQLELLRRLAVNELLGNFDAHVKNFGVRYADGRTPSLSPAYDVVAYAAQMPGRGHALKFSQAGAASTTLGPRAVREFCAQVRLPETVAQGAIRQTVKRAAAAWPDMIQESELLPQQKAHLLRHFEGTELVRSVRRRAGRHAPT